MGIIYYVFLSQILCGLLVNTIIRTYPSPIELDEVDALTQNISDPIQRKIVAVQLLYCPSVPLCDNLTWIQSYSARFDHFNGCCNDITYGDECPIHPLEVKNSDMCIRPQYLREGQSSVNSPYSYIMIDRCSSGFTDSVTGRKCTSRPADIDWFDLSLFVPVSSVANDIIYKNRYCAFCNNEKLENIVDWKAQLTCNNNRPPLPQPPVTLLKLLHMIKGYTHCNIEFYDPSSTTSVLCNWGKYTKCNQTGKWKSYDKLTEHGCNSYTSVYNGEYRNVFCFLCNEDGSPGIQCTGSDTSVSGGRFGTFTGLLRYRPEPDVNTSKSALYPEDDIYDSYEV